MFRDLEELPEDLRRFMSQPEDLVLPFCFVGDNVGTAIDQIAAGKAPINLLRQISSVEGTPPDDLRVAALRFIAKVMLATSSDLFTVLGVSLDSEPAAYRDNYRRLMAMVHPDARPTGFPTDAAIRVNHAYAVLSDVEQLEQYKRQRVAQLGAAVSVSSNLTQRVSATHAKAKGKGKAPPTDRSGLAGRMAALLFRAQERSALLGLALLLLLPVGGALYETFAGSPQVRLVEARPKLALSQAAASLAPTTTSDLNTPSARANKAEKVSTDTVQSAAARKSLTSSSLRPESSAAIQTTPTLALETSLSISRLTTPVPPPTAVPPATVAQYTSTSNKIGALAPTQSLESMRGRLSTAVAVEVPPLVNSAPSPVRTESQFQTSDKSKPLTVVSAASTTTQAKFASSESRAPITTAAGTSITYRLRSVDVEDVLMRFSNAYESGSLPAFEQVLAPGMQGRGQLLSDYGRVFERTANRSIRFIQLKHAATGDKMSTRGYAMVTTTDHENRVSKQRVYIEIEIGIDRDVPRIERISNYVIN